MKRSATIAMALPLALLFGFALWYRVSSLEALPEPDGDEAWYAIQYQHLLRGEAFSARTPHGNPLSLFHAAIQVPLLLAFRPSLWILRMPSVVTGILAVVLTYVLGSRMLDRRTALIASALMAVLPVAIIASRTGYESSQAPLYSLILIYLAHRLRTAGLAIGLVACYFFVHPTTIFLLPVLLAVVLARSLGRPEGDPAREPRRYLTRLAALGAIGLGLGIFTLSRPKVAAMSSTFQMGPRGHHDLAQYLALFGRLFLGIGPVPRPWPERAFWAVFLTLVALGSWRLVRDRRWDRTALVAGLLASAAGLFVVGGSLIIIGGATRFGYFLIAPAALAAACLANSLLIDREGGLRTIGRHAQYAAMLAMGWALLLNCRLERLTKDRTFAGAPRAEESLWTFRTDVKDAKQRAYQSILADIARGDGPAAGRTHVIIAEDWWIQRPIQYLASSRRDVKVVELGKTLVPPGDPLRILREQLQAGSYAVVYPGQPIEGLLKLLLPPGEARSWDIDLDGAGVLRVYRKETSAVASATPASKSR